MSLRADLIPLVDTIRADVIDGVAGLRLHTVSIRVRTWDGGAIGRGAVTETLTELVPKPKVMDPSPRLIMAQPGTYQDGDRLVSKISATYTEDQLVIPPSAAVEVAWLIDDDEYFPVGQPQVGYLGWKVQVRRRRRK